MYKSVSTAAFQLTFQDPHQVIMSLHGVTQIQKSNSMRVSDQPRKWKGELLEDQPDGHTAPEKNSDTLTRTLSHEKLHCEVDSELFTDSLIPEASVKFQGVFQLDWLV